MLINADRSLALPPSIFHHVRASCVSDVWRRLATTVFTAKLPLEAIPCAFLHNLAIFSAYFSSTLKIGGKKFQTSAYCHTVQNAKLGKALNEREILK